MDILSPPPLCCAHGNPALDWPKGVKNERQLLTFDPKACKRDKSSSLARVDKPCFGGWACTNDRDGILLGRRLVGRDPLMLKLVQIARLNRSSGRHEMTCHAEPIHPDRARRQSVARALPWSLDERMLVLLCEGLANLQHLSSL